MGALPRIDAVDRVIHKSNAVSPGPVGDVERPWYMHPHQDDNLLVLQGTRYVDIYRKRYEKMEHFVVRADHIEKSGRILYDGPAMLVWPRGVFHRIRTGEDGSASLNLLSITRDLTFKPTSIFMISIRPAADSKPFGKAMRTRFKGRNGCPS